MMYDHPPAPIVVCHDCTQAEKDTLKFLQNRGIRNINALATVMGNIKQESKFDHLICEGGQRTGYRDCTRGGFGLIQWTTQNRYLGLGRFCLKYMLSPDTLNAQLRYMVNENQWVQFERYLRTPDKSVEYYMKYAYHWLGWGIHGNRTHYAYNYVNRFRVVVPPVKVSTLFPIVPPPAVY